MPEENKEITFKKCPFCQASIGNGLSHYVSDKDNSHKVRHKLVCICGWVSTGHKTKESLANWFNARAGRKPKEAKVEIKPAEREISGKKF